MKKLKIIIPIIIIFFVVLIAIIIACKKNNNSNYIPDDYIAILNGGSGERTHSTYIYIIGSSYKYINTVNTTSSWGSTEWTSKVIKSGKTKNINKIFKIAKKNGAYSYVTVQNCDKIFTIEEFKNMINN